jgi:Transmembrane secretion effector
LTLHLDRTVSVPWPEPVLAFEPSPTDGPVQVDIRYVVQPGHQEAFIAAMHEVSRGRRRTGAQRWRSWREHLRQHQDRMTGFDQQVLDEARALAEPDPLVLHLFAGRVGSAVPAVPSQPLSLTE